MLKATHRRQFSNTPRLDPSLLQAAAPRCCGLLPALAACHRARASRGFEIVGSMISCWTPVLAVSSTT